MGNLTHVETRFLRSRDETIGTQGHSEVTDYESKEKKTWNGTLEEKRKKQNRCASSED